MTLPDTLITTYLEMRTPPPSLSIDPPPQTRIMPMKTPDLDFYRFLYRTVGERWRWRDRLRFSDDDLLFVLNNPGMRVDVLYVKGAPAGFIELEWDGDEIEVAYFGLREPFFGRGLGRYLLNCGIQEAWTQKGTRRLWLHTCNLDGPHALKNYQARGFTIYDVKKEPMPDVYR